MNGALNHSFDVFPILLLWKRHALASVLQGSLPCEITGTSNGREDQVPQHRFKHCQFILHVACVHVACGMCPCGMLCPLFGKQLLQLTFLCYLHWNRARIKNMKKQQNMMFLLCFLRSLKEKKEKPLYCNAVVSMEAGEVEWFLLTLTKFPKQAQKGCIQARCQKHGSFSESVITT